MDKWTGDVDNPEGVGKMRRMTANCLWMARGWVVGFSWAVRGLAQPWPGGHGEPWGDVDRLSTCCARRNPRDDAGIPGYPRTPHHYGKDGYFFNKKERYVWKTIGGVARATSSWVLHSFLVQPRSLQQERRPVDQR